MRDLVSRLVDEEKLAGETILRVLQSPRFGFPKNLTKQETDALLALRDAIVEEYGPDTAMFIVEDL